MHIKKRTNDPVKSELDSAKKPADEKLLPKCIYTWEEYASQGEASGVRCNRDDSTASR